MANKKDLTYEEAYKRLSEIVGEIENGETDLDRLSQKVKEAKKLIKFCTDMLNQVEGDVKKCLEDGQE